MYALMRFLGSILLSQPQLNSKVGFDMKMTLHHNHHPPQTQCQQYLSCYWPNFNQTLKVGFWDLQQQQQQKQQHLKQQHLQHLIY